MATIEEIAERNALGNVLSELEYQNEQLRQRVAELESALAPFAAFGRFTKGDTELGYIEAGGLFHVLYIEDGRPLMTRHLLLAEVAMIK